MSAPRLWLAIDTSTPSLSIAALTTTGEVIAERQADPPLQQSELLPGAILELLAPHGGLAAVEGFIAGLGPGSFTGLRVGLGCLKALAYARARPLLGASSLAAAALDGPANLPLAVVATVKRGELYLGRYRHDGTGNITTLHPDTWGTTEACAKLYAEMPNAILMGPAAQASRDAMGASVDQTSPAGAVPRARHLFALTRPAPGMPFRVTDVFAIEPKYLRTSAAEDSTKLPLPPTPTAR